MGRVFLIAAVGARSGVCGRSMVCETPQLSAVETAIFIDGAQNVHAFGSRTGGKNSSMIGSRYVGHGLA